MSQPGPAADVGLDPDLARVAIDKLRALRERIEEIRREATDIGRIPETAFDAVSRASYAILREKADGGPGSLTWALSGGIEYVDKIILQLESDLADVVGLDTASASRLSLP